MIQLADRYICMYVSNFVYLHCTANAGDDGILWFIILSSWPKRDDDGTRQDNIGMRFLCLHADFCAYSLLSNISKSGGNYTLLLSVLEHYCT